MNIISLPSALIDAGYTETSPGHFRRGDNDFVGVYATGRVLFHNSDGDGRWRSTLQAIRDVLKKQGPAAA